MKSLKIITLLLVMFTVFATSCKKENTSSNDDDLYVKGWTRVIGVKDTDTSTTKFMHARTETVGLLMVEDNMLKAELIAYSPLPNNKGQFVIQITNKQAGPVTLDWSWEDLVIYQTTPGSNVLNANQVITFTLIGDANPGRIKVKANKNDNSCSNSSTLILNITNTILPIEFTSCTTQRKGKDMYVTFSTDAPEDVDMFYVLWSPDDIKANESIKAFIESDHKTKSFKVSYPAVKKEDLK